MSLSISRVVILGTGRVGELLLSILREGGGTITGISTRSETRLQRLSTNFPSSVVSRWKHSDEFPGELRQTLAAESGLLVLATPDDALVLAISRVVSLRKSWVGWSVLHCSGALGLSPLSPFVAAGARSAVLHPCYPVVGEISPENRLKMVFTVQGSDNEVAGELQALITNWGAKAFVVEGLNCALYHAAQVLGAGHVVALYSLVESLLVKSGTSAEVARAIVLSLLNGIGANIDAAEARALFEVITGPFVRGDRELINKQQSLLDSVDKQASELYLFLGSVIERTLATK